MQPEVSSTIKEFTHLRHEPLPIGARNARQLTILYVFVCGGQSGLIAHPDFQPTGNRIQFQRTRANPQTPSGAKIMIMAVRAPCTMR